MLAFYFSPYGRTTRADYWTWLVGPYFGIVVFALILFPDLLGDEFTRIFLADLTIVFFVSHTVLAIRRLHDLSITGWWVVALFVPFIFAIWLTFDPRAIDFGELDRSDDVVKLTVLAMFSAVFAPFAYTLGLIWLEPGIDGKNRYGYDPLYR